MKKAAIAKLIIYSFTALLLTAILTLGILFDLGTIPRFSRYTYSSGFEYKEKEEAGFEPADSDTMTFTDIDSLSIEWTAGEVIIQKGDGDTVTVSESAGFQLNDNQKMRFSQNGSTLKIKFSKPIINWGFGTSNIWSKELIVTLPEKLYNSVSVETVSADVEIYGLNTQELDIETVSGDITLSGVDTSELNCESVSGDLDAADFKAAEVDCETVSGNMDVDGMILTSGSFNSVSGNVELRLPPVMVYALDMNTFSGRTTMNGNNNVNKDDKRADVKISMESFSGDITFSSNIVSIYNSYDEFISSFPEDIQEYITDMNAG